jgi:O-antigen ligase
MSTGQIEFPVFPAGGGTETRRRPAIAMPDESGRRVNRILGGVIVAIVAIAPIPLGSNRPAFWAAWGVVLGLLGIAYGFVLASGRVEARLTLRQLWPEATLFALAILYMLLQMLPLDGWLPAQWMQLPPLGQHLRTISSDPGSTWLTLLQFVTFGMVFMLSAIVSVNRRRARRILFAIMVIIAAFAVVGLVSLTQGDTLLGFIKTDYLGYATGTFINRNSYATFLAAGLVVATVVLISQLQTRPLNSRPRTSRLVPIITAIVCLMLMGPTLLATGSRMGTISGGVGVIAVLLLSIKPLKLSGMRAALIILLVLVGAGALIAAFGLPLIERLVLIPSVDESRVALHAQIWEQIWQRPWLGYGAGSFGSINASFVRPPLLGTNVWEHTHSTYLALWYELGLIVGSLPLLIIALLVVRTAMALRNPSSTAVSVATLGVVVVFAVHSLLDFSAEMMANAFLLTVVLALGAAGQKAERGAEER